MALGRNSIVMSLVLQYQQFKQDAQAASKTWKKVGSDMTSVGRDLTFAISAPLILIARQAYQTGEEFDLARQKLKGFTSGSAEGISTLEKQARELGATTIFTATEVINLQLALRRLGKENSTIEQITPTILKFSQALDTDLAEAGEFIVQTMNRMDKSFSAFSSESSAAEFAAEGFAYAVANSALTVDGLRASLNYVGSEANAAGLSFAETTSLLAALADRGYTGSRAGTALRRVFTELTKDGRDVSKEFFEIIRAGYSFEQALEIVGVRAAGVFSALGGNSEDIQKFTQAIIDSQNVLGNFAKEMDDSLYASSKKVESAFAELSISITDDLKPAITTVNDFIARLIRGFSEFNPIIKVLIVALGGLVALLPVLTFLFGAYTKAAALAASTNSAFLASIAAISPYVAPVLAILGLLALAFGGVSAEAKAAEDAAKGYRDELDKLARTGDRVAVIKKAIEDQEVASNLKRIQESNLANQEAELKVLQEKLDLIRKEAQYVVPVGMGTQLVTRPERKEELDQAQRLFDTKQAEVNLTRQSIAENEAVLNVTSDILAVNQDIVDSILDESNADKKRYQSIVALKNEYKKLQSNIQSIQSLSQRVSVVGDEDLEAITKWQERLEEIEDIFEKIGVTIDSESPLDVLTVKGLISEYKRLKSEISGLGEEFSKIELDKLTTELSDVVAILNKLGIDPTKEIVSQKSYENAEALRNAVIKAEEALDEARKKEPLDPIAVENAIKNLNEIVSLAQAYGIELSSIEGSKAFKSDALSEYNSIVQSLVSQNEQFSRANETAEKTIKRVTDTLFKLGRAAGLTGLDFMKISEITGEWSDAMRKAETDANALKKEMEQQAAFSAMQQNINGLVVGFLDLADGTRSFEDVIISSLKRILAQVLTLIVAWAVLNALTGNAAGITGAANLKSFLTSSMFGNFQTLSKSTSSNRVVGAISGSNLVITTERGITAYDRTYG